MKLLIGNFKGPKGEQGNEGKKGDNGDKGEKGERGSRWTSGTAITGTSTIETIFADSGITDAKIDDYYINTTTGNLYQCTASGAADTAKWVYIGNFKGPKGNDGPAGSISDINDQIPTYEESTQFENIESGETVKIAFGKLKKALSVFIVHHTQKATAAIIGHVKLSNSAAITKAGEYALDAIEKNAAIEGTLANLINSLNSNLAGKLNNKGFYTAQGIDGSGISINDMTAPGIYRFYVNPNTDNANYLGWTARTLLICTGDCAGYVHQIFYSNWGHCVFRRNEIQGILTFDYNLPLYHIDAKSEIAELSKRITALEGMIKSNG